MLRSIPARLVATLAVVALVAVAFAIPGAEPEAQAPPPTRPPGPPAIGVNLAELSWYSTEYPFADAFLCSSPFLHQREGQWEMTEPLELGPAGYPARIPPGDFAGTLMFRELQGRYPGGDYTCLWEGDGELAFGFDAALLRGEPGRATVRVRPGDGGIWLKITRTDPADPLRRIRLLLPGIDPEAPPLFHPDFLARWRGVKALRFMDWQRTNGSRLERWAERPTPGLQTQASERGVAAEHIAALCNELDADPWVCLPHLAGDDYAEELGRLLASRLEPERRVLVEYSNECWNGTFAQAQWCREQGLALGLSADPFCAQLRYYSQRAVAALAAFRAGFGAPARVVRVLAVQNANPWTGQEVVGWKDAWKQAEALAVAPYFGNGLGDPARRYEVRSWPVDEVLRRCREDAEASVKAAAVHYRTARTHDLELIAYEGGAHLAGYGGAENDEDLTRLLAEASRHAEMGAIYQEHLRRWREIGGGLWCAFHSTGAYSKWGCWGLAEHYGEGSADAPKLRAVRMAWSPAPAGAPR